MRIEFETREVYGRTVAYPANETARWAASLAGTKTLTQYALLCLLKMGAELVLVAHGRPLRGFSGADDGESERTIRTLIAA